MKRVMVFTAASAVLATSGLAMAQGYGGRQGGQEQARMGQGARAVMMLGAADLNGDNTVTRAEVDQLRSEEFAYRDRNADGFLDIQDASPTRQRMAALYPDAGERDTRRTRRGGRQGQDGADDRMARLDTNEDKRVSRAEFMNRPSQAFDRLDTNNDDAVTPAELDAALDQRAQRRAQNRTPWWRD